MTRGYPWLVPGRSRGASVKAGMLMKLMIDSRGLTTFDHPKDAPRKFEKASFHCFCGGGTQVVVDLDDFASVG